VSYTVVVSETSAVGCNHTLPFLYDGPLTAKHSRSVSSATHDIIRLDPRLTTKDVCEELIKPLTRTHECSFVDMCGRHGKETALGSRIDKAEVFVSHAWKYSFAGTVDALQLWFETTRRRRHLSADQGSPAGARKTSESSSINDTARCFVWFDICTVNQHAGAQSNFPEGFFFNEFREGIQSIGCTVLILRPMLQPVALTRSWCCWEIFCTIDADLQFETALSRRDQRMGATHSMTSSMECNVELAQAWSQDDKETILAACQSVPGGGCTAVNTAIKHAFSFDQVRKAIDAHKTGAQSFFSVSGQDIGTQGADAIADYFASADRPVMPHAALTYVVLSVPSFKRIARSMSALGAGLGQISMRTLATVDDEFFAILGESLASTPNVKNIWFNAFMLANSDDGISDGAADGACRYPGFCAFLKRVLHGLPNIEGMAFSFGHPGNSSSQWKDALPPDGYAHVFESRAVVDVLVAFLDGSAAARLGGGAKNSKETSLCSLSFKHARASEEVEARLRRAAEATGRWEFGIRGPLIFLKVLQHGSEGEM
jgi:hypothetical protein